MIKCPICNTVFDENLEHGYDEFAVHVQKCAADASLKKKTENMKKINEELEEVKRARTCYEGLRDQFKEKYPEVYKANFQDSGIDNKSSNKSNNIEVKNLDELLILLDLINSH